MDERVRIRTFKHYFIKLDMPGEVSKKEKEKL